jgi:hypothetical protein
MSTSKELPTIRRVNQFKLLLMILFACFYALAIPYPEKSRQFPQLISLLSLIMLAVSFLTDMVNKKGVKMEVGTVEDGELQEVREQGKGEKKKRFFKAWGIILVSFGAGLLGGFAFTAFFLFAGFALFFGSRQKLLKNIIIAVVMTVCIFLVFQQVMAVPLLTGILW